MKRIIALLISMLLILSLCACGENGTGNGSADGPSEEVQTAYAYMLTCMRERENDSNCKLYRYDYNLDGTDDWIIFNLERTGPLWMLLDGASLDSSPKLIYSWVGGGAATKLYISESDANLYVEYLYSSVNRGYSSYYQFDGKLSARCAHFNYTNSMSTTDYEVNGEKATSEEHDTFVRNLNLREVEKGDAFANAPLEFGSADFEKLAAEIASFSFIEKENSGDIDGDGKDDYIFSTVFDGSELKGISAVDYNGNGTNPEDPVWNWKSTYFVLMSNSFCPTLSAISKAEYTKYSHESKDDEDGLPQGEWPVGKWVYKDFDADCAYYLYNDGRFEYKGYAHPVEGKWYIENGSVILEEYLEDSDSYNYYTNLKIEGNLLAHFSAKTVEYLERVS